MLKQRPNLWAFVTQSEAADEEHFTDVGVESSCDGRGSQMTGGSGYQIAARNPLYSKADTSCLLELSRLQSHYHPSVQAFTNKIAQVRFEHCDESHSKLGRRWYCPTEEVLQTLSVFGAYPWIDKCYTV